jgi:hypothetical protein
MTTAKYFNATDYDLTLRLQALFDETVDLQSQLDHSKFENTCMREKQRALTLKLNAAHKKISLLVKKMKHLQSDTETISADKLPSFLAR